MKILLFFLVLGTLRFGHNAQLRTYIIKPTLFTTTDIVQTLPDSEWEKAVVLSDFILPWNEEKPQGMVFRALHNTSYLFLRYDVEDEKIQIFEDKDTTLAVGKSDRVEIFMRKDEKMKPYYGLEIAPNGMVMDYEANYYREIDQKWSWPQNHLHAKGSITKTGYRMEIIISKASLIALGLIGKDGTMQAGIYRGDCVQLAKDRNEESLIKWITWVDPKTEKPDFHVPSSFGHLVFQDGE